MSENCVRKGLPGAALFGIAFGAGLLSGAALAIILLEVREGLIRSAASRKRGLHEFLLDVASDFTMLTDDIVGEVTTIKRASGLEERTAQGMKTRFRHGGSLDESGETMEMSALYDAITPEDD